MSLAGAGASGAAGCESSQRSGCRPDFVNQCPGENISLARPRFGDAVESPYFECLDRGGGTLAVTLETMITGAAATA